MSAGRPPAGITRKPITCPAPLPGDKSCGVVTAVPWGGQMWLTDAAAGFYPHGFRCKAHKRHDVPDIHPQPAGAPPRLPRSASGRGAAA